MADWRDHRMGEQGDLWHRAIIDPTLLRVVGPVRGLRVLDLACGNGYLTRRWAREGAARSVGVDLSRRTLSFARRRERARPSGARFLLGSASDLKDLVDSSFDLVVSNMALIDIPDLRGAFREVRRVLDPTGRFVFSISHPCFDIDDRSLWVVERGLQPTGAYADTVWRKVRGYRREEKRPIPWPVSPTRTVFTDSFHRTLATYSRYLREAGFVIRRLEEPAPQPEMLEGSPQGPYIAEIPLHLVVEAVRHDVVRPASRPSGGSRREAVRRSGSRARSRGIGSGRRGSTTGS
jgi:SAM-dependent methyltransferase